MMANLSSVWRFLIVILFCISLVISNVEHLYMCLLAICMSSLDKYLPKSSALLFSLSFGLLLLLLLSCFSCSYMQNLNEFVRKKTFKLKEMPGWMIATGALAVWIYPSLGSGHLRWKSWGVLPSDHTHTHQSHQDGGAGNTRDDSYPGHSYPPCWELHSVFSRTGFLRSEHFILGAEYGEGVKKILSFGLEQRLKCII